MGWYIKKNDDILIHSGTKGMKWGVRKYQNEDGSLTPEGKERYKNMMPSSALKAKTQAENGITNRDPNRHSGPNEYDRLVRATGLNGTGADRKYVLETAISDAQAYFEIDNKGKTREEMVSYCETKYENDCKEYGKDIADKLNVARIDMLRSYDSKKQQEKQIRDKAQKALMASKMGKGSIPTSALKARNDAIIRNRIPASAWDAKTKR